MRTRALSPDGDFVMGRSQWLVDSPQAVVQTIQTRLALMTGEWFLDADEGTPYSTKILGYGTKDVYDNAIRTRVLGTPGVSSITQYSSSMSDRRLSVSMTVDTIYGSSSIITITL